MHSNDPLILSVFVVGVFDTYAKFFTILFKHAN